MTSGEKGRPLSGLCASLEVSSPIQRSVADPAKDPDPGLAGGLDEEIGAERGRTPGVVSLYLGRESGQCLVSIPWTSGERAPYSGERSSLTPWLASRDQRELSSSSRRGTEYLDQRLRVNSLADLPPNRISSAATGS